MTKPNQPHPPNSSAAERLAWAYSYILSEAWGADQEQPSSSLEHLLPGDPSQRQTGPTNANRHG